MADVRKGSGMFWECLECLNTPSTAPKCCTPLPQNLPRQTDKQDKQSNKQRRSRQMRKQTNKQTHTHTHNKQKNKTKRIERAWASRPSASKGPRPSGQRQPAAQKPADWSTLSQLCGPLHEKIRKPENNSASKSTNKQTSKQPAFGPIGT